MEKQLVLVHSKLVLFSKLVSMLFELYNNDLKVHYCAFMQCNFYKVKNTAEPRKKVQQRKEKQQEKADSVPFLVG